MNILVTGACGQLGMSIRDCSLDSVHNYLFSDLEAGQDVVALDVTDSAKVERMVRDNSIDVIINCAAYTDVNKAETDRQTAYMINAQAPEVLAKAAAAVDALLVHVSTDYVFDGKSHVPYNESCEPHPLNVYGASKLAGEKAVQQSGCRYLILRTSWLYSSYGKNFVLKMLELMASRPNIDVVCDQVGTPTYAGDLAAALYEILENNIPFTPGIYHYSNEGVCSWFDFAKEICSGAGYLCDVRPCMSEKFPGAQRPNYSVLDKTRFKTMFNMEIPHWRESLMVCLSEISR